MTRTRYGLAVSISRPRCAGCDESLRDFAGPTPELAATFSSIQRDIFNAPDSAGRLACTGCHNPQGGDINGGLNLTGAAPTRSWSTRRAPASQAPSEWFLAIQTGAT